MVLSITLGIGLLLLLVRLSRLDLWKMLLQVRNLSLLDLLQLFVLNGVLVYVSTEKWLSIDAALHGPRDSSLSRIEAFTLSGTGMALGLVLPVQFGLSTVRTAGVYSHGSPIKRGIAATLFEQSFDILVGAVLAVASLITLLCRGGATMWMLCAIALGMLLFLAVRPSIRAIRQFAVYLADRPAVSKYRGLSFVRKLCELCHSDLLSARLVRRLIVLSTARFCVVVLMCLQVARAIGVKIPAWHMAAAVPFTVVASAIALTPGGLGLSELTSAGALKIFGTPLAVGATWAVANRVLILFSYFAVAGSAAIVWFMERAVAAGPAAAAKAANAAALAASQIQRQEQSDTDVASATSQSLTAQVR
ncbi:MAG TPA: lysylphosphatidylglycerol synthase transmembrane domain-containing protein [Terriglobales bacterium]|jgi:uncharacterized membrane protein YbhN (UPF0104 family)